MNGKNIEEAAEHTKAYAEIRKEIYTSRRGISFYPHELDLLTDKERVEIEQLLLRGCTYGEKSYYPYIPYFRFEDPEFLVEREAFYRLPGEEQLALIKYVYLYSLNDKYLAYLQEKAYSNVDAFFCLRDILGYFKAYHQDWAELEKIMEDIACQKNEPVYTVVYERRNKCDAVIVNGCYCSKNAVIQKMKEREPFMRQWIKKMIGYETEEDFVRITSLNQELSGKVVLPEIIDGLPVREITNKSRESAHNAITEIVFPATLKCIDQRVFLGYEHLEKIYFPEGLESIGYNTFFGCDSLKEVVLPKGLSYICPNAFSYCHNLSRIEVHPDNPYLVSIDGVVFSKDRMSMLMYPEGKEGNCYEIPSSVHVLGQNAFSNSEYLEEIRVPASVCHIEQLAFSGCKKLKTVMFLDQPGSRTLKMDFHAFCRCEKLENVYFPDRVKVLGNCIFDNCTALTTVYLPAGITEVGKEAFEKCSSLTRILVDDKNPKYESYGGVLFSKGRRTLIAYPPGKKDSTYQIPDSVQRIFEYAFQTCENLTEVIIPDSVVSIGKYAFSCCRALKHIQLPDSIQTLGFCAFEGCESLISAVLPQTLKKIEFQIFSKCASLTEVTLPKDMQEMGHDMFLNCPNLAAVRISEENQRFKSVDGILYDVQKKELLVYPPKCSKKIYQIPEEIESIDSHAFNNGAECTEIHIPASIDWIYHTFSGSFRECRNLTNFVVSNENSGYVAVEGVLFSADMKTLVAYPANKADSVYQIPDTVVTIIQDAFYHCANLEEIIIPPNVTRIGGSFAWDANFKGCRNLKKAIFGYSIPTEGIKISLGEPRPQKTSYNMHFDECPNLTVYAPRDSYVHYLALSKKWKFEERTDICISKSDMYRNWYMYLQDSGTDGRIILQCMNGKYSVIWNARVSRFDEDGEKFEVPDLYTLGLEKFQELLEQNIKNRIRNIRYGFHVPSLKELSKLTELCELFEKESLAVDEEEDAGYEETDVFCAEYAFKLLNSSVKGYWEEPYGKVVIPEQNAGFPIECIDFHAFEKCGKIKKVILPDSVRIIESRAFKMCSGLELVRFSENLESIGEDAFSHCDRLQKIYLPKTVKEIGKNAFEGCKSLRRFHIESGNPRFTSQDGVLFYKDKQVLLIYPPNKPNKVYYIPDGVKWIDRKAFSECNFLTELYIPSSVIKIHDEAFTRCNMLKYIHVAEDNPNYVSVDGILFTKDLTKLIVYPAQKQDRYYEVPDTVKQMCWGAFEGNAYLEEIVVGSGLSQIPMSAFRDCTSLTTVKLPDSLRKIEPHAFCKCRNLKNINIPENVRSVGLAFWYCESLEEIVLPKGLIQYYGNEFNYCDRLRKIHIDPENPYFESEDGVVFTKGKHVLVSYPGGKEEPIYCVPHEVRKFEQLSFYGCQYLREVRILDGVKEGNLPEIRCSTFVKCPQLATVAFGNHRFRIGKRYLSKQEPGVWKIMLRAYEPDGCILLRYENDRYSLECKERDNAARTVPQKKTVEIPDVAMMTAETFYETAQQALGTNICEKYNFPTPDELRQMKDLAVILKAHD